jgi:hypothetical protein
VVVGEGEAGLRALWVEIIISSYAPIGSLARRARPASPLQLSSKRLGEDGLLHLRQQCFVLPLDCLKLV